MLVLSRKTGERVVIGHEIEVIVLEVSGNRVKLGFRGPKEVPIHRKELQEKIDAAHPSRYQADCA
ncbi:MAG: carbon storage regulator [Planctomycetes bacterium RBG_13_63_9]|nr:MAG: carbon storage regulator [Planctomycetes bacterium RBG_13_63_9]